MGKLSWLLLVVIVEIATLSNYGRCQSRGGFPGFSNARYPTRAPTTRRPITPTNGILRLGRYPVERGRVTISGFSSGGTLAQQMIVSHAELFSGVGVFSHAYYRCGPGDGSIDNYDSACTKLLPGPDKVLWNPENAVTDIRNYARQGLISDPKELANKKLYVYAGLNNVFFTLDSSLDILKVFEPFITNPLNIRTRVQDANWVLPVDVAGPRNCSVDPQGPNSLFIANCGLNGPLEALQFILGDFVRPGNGNVRLNPLRMFDQREFLGTSGLDFMDDVGYIYVPTGCERSGRTGGGRQSGSRCFLHVYLHGCLTGRRFIGDAHIRQSGYLEIGERNRIIMLFPQNVNITGEDIGCWDTFGGTGPLYATREGNQIRVIKAMVSRILGEGGTTSLEKRQNGRKPDNGYSYDINGIDPRR